MNKKENSGYVRTHQKIQDSLLTLLEQKNFQNITVNDVCTLSNINRSTFYAHFQDLYAVLEAMEQKLENDLVEAYSTSYTKGDNFISAEYLVILIEHIKENKVFYQAYLSDSTSMMMEKSMELLRTEIVVPLYERIGVSDRQGMYYFSFFKAGFTTILKQWLSDGCPEPSQQLAKIIFSCLPSMPPDVSIF